MSSYLGILAAQYGNFRIISTTIKGQGFLPVKKHPSYK